MGVSNKKGVVVIIRIEVDIFNKKKIKQLEGENLILKQQLANYRNEILEWNRRFNYESARIATAHNN